MPMIGFGTWKITDADIIYNALKNGYRHFDTARRYENEEQVGEGLNRGIKEGICKREDLYITTKLWHEDYADVEDAVKTSLKKLGTDYVDMYLIHWPMHSHIPNKVPQHVLWKNLEELVKKGYTKAIGLSNYNIQLTADILTYAEIKPACNQIQLYPECAQDDLVKWLQSVGIAPVAWSPLGRMGVPVIAKEQKFECIKHPYILELAKKYERTPTQIILAWGMARGCVVIPKASSNENQLSNWAAKDFTLTQEEVQEVMKQMDTHNMLLTAIPNTVSNIFA